MPLRLLPEVVREVGKDVEIAIDTGIVSGADIIASTALGAKFTLIGRAYLYGVIAERLTTRGEGEVGPADSPGPGGGGRSGSALSTGIICEVTRAATIACIPRSRRRIASCPAAFNASARSGDKLCR